nr:LOW QUALITY PROTEIN: protein turtle homolog A [Pelodiscus sinensis]|eukprot:XP_025036564.1 LOW QUALITY PROTEIN: protein turtle homolog A [Pelodiscus sinensis]
MNWCLWIAYLSLFAINFAEGNGQAEAQAVVGRVGESAILGCDLLNAEEARPPLYVIEWVRFGFLLPIFIKFGLYSPRVDPEYVGRVRIQEGASLRIDLLRTEDQGWYECRVLFLDRHSNDDEFRNGTWIHLTVNSPPTFLETPPALVEVPDRESLTLTCSAIGNPQPVIAWKRNDLPIQSGDKVQVSNGTLRIASVERASAGTYTCHASSKEGCVTHTLRLLVQGPPVIVVPPQNITVNITQDAFLACQAEAYPGNLTYSWFQGDSNVYHLSHLQARIRVLVDGSLLLQKTIPDDTGKYTCVPSNGLRTPPSASAFLTVLYPAQVTTMPPETLLPMGMQGVIQCPARANPPLLSVSWTKDGHPLELDKFPGWSMAPDGSILIATGNDDALGLYTCTAYNSYGTAGTSAPTRVVLKEPPVFTVRPKEEYFQEVGRELVIPCAAQGDPPPTVTWAKLGSTGRNGTQVGGNSSLVFWPLVKEQHGAWQCTASNQVARISTITSVYVLGTSPHAVTNVSVQPLLLAANISWEPGFDGGYFQRFSVWYTPLVKLLNRPHHDWVSLTVPVGARHLLVENLQPATGHPFSVPDRQRDVAGGPAAVGAPAAVLRGPDSPEWLPWFLSSMSPFPPGFPATEVPLEPPTTAPRVFLSPPQSLTANETSRGVLLQWEPPLQFSVALTGYALELWQGPGGWGGGTQVLVPGLIKDAFYEFRLVAFAGSYISYPSNTVNVSTAGMEVYPSRTQLPELLPQPVLAGVIGGICFLSMAVIFSTMVACVMNRRRAARLQKRRQDPPIVFSPNKKLPPPQNSNSSSSSDSTLKLKLSASPYQSLHRTLLWSEKASSCLGLTMAGGPRTSSKYTVYESHIGDAVPLERISRGPDGRFVVETDRQPQELFPCAPNDWGLRHGRYFGYSSSSPTEEAKPLCIVNISPVASPVPLPLSAVEEVQGGPGGEGHCQSTVSVLRCSPGPGGSPVLSRLLPAPALASPEPLGSGSPSSSAQSGILQSLSLPFFKEMSVDGDWPPQEEPCQPPALGSTEPTLLGEEREQSREGAACLDYMDTRATPLPFFKEMSVDGDWPPQEEPCQPPALGSTEPTLLGEEREQSREGAACLDYMDTRATPESPLEQAPSKTLLKPPEPQLGPAKAALPGSTGWPGSLSPGSTPLLATDSSRTELMCTAISSEPSWARSLQEQPLPGELLEAQVPEKYQAPGIFCLPGPPAEKLLRASLTSNSSGRGSVSFLRPPSLALSLVGTYLSSPLGEIGGWPSGGESRSSVTEEGRPRKELAIATVSKRRNTSVDENYEWDSEFALESDILEALQLYRSGDPRRPVSTIAVQELERQSAKAPSDGSGSPRNSKSVDDLEAPGSPRALASPEARCAVLKEEFLAYRRRREVLQQRRQRLSSRGYDERFEQATLL